MSISPQQKMELQGKRLADFATLGYDWDSYGGRPISAAALAAVSDLWCSPSPSGGIQVEWHVCGHEVEIEFATNGEVVSVYWERVTGQNGAEA